MNKMILVYWIILGIIFISTPGEFLVYPGSNGFQYLISENDDKLTFDDALMSCNSQDYTLACITNKEEFDIINATLSGLTNRQMNYWIGLYTNETCSRCPSDHCLTCLAGWKWVDGTPMSGQLLHDYSHFSGEEHCARLSYDNVLGFLFKDITCNERYNYMCKQDTIPTTPTTTTTTTTPTTTTTATPTITTTTPTTTTTTPTTTTTTPTTSMPTTRTNTPTTPSTSIISLTSSSISSTSTSPANTSTTTTATLSRPISTESTRDVTDRVPYQSKSLRNVLIAGWVLAIMSVTIVAIVIICLKRFDRRKKYEESSPKDDGPRVSQHLQSPSATERTNHSSAAKSNSGASSSRKKTAQSEAENTC